MTDLTKLMGVGPAMALKLDEMGVSTLEDMARADAAKIAELPRVTTARAQDWIDSASRLTAPAPDADVPAAVASDVPRTADTEAMPAPGTPGDDKLDAAPEPEEAPRLAPEPDPDSPLAVNDPLPEPPEEDIEPAGSGKRKAPTKPAEKGKKKNKNGKTAEKKKSAGKKAADEAVSKKKAKKKAKKAAEADKKALKKADKKKADKPKKNKKNKKK
ncbi:MAG: hypothetical protein CML50_17530 [Rhodobacteraceae bacterium]|uniref:Helix-hairpin-helix domain-containing protein n=1 Tax=Salipiger profundus TaxID=1229727 RepID=A0A1U7D9Y6_9RHOB|nr:MULTISPECIES: helix-hairpin-helix domain-containing protein [Salipiger]APX24886.1 Helix-hairpin-helix domain-containing protein [Salipiger profundus]MAB07800.1 hypothetical protein [Paracoccaceae bacterium]GFZ98592.1 hypothetical protein GCM10011326_07430 [Salipiger profundus]SFC96085.1 Helix-hairpin-helix domain-containing protein [Salipiger profundus]